MKGNYKHGHSAHPLYRVWRTMWDRCIKPHAPHYQNYGGRGIRVCDEWAVFTVFLEWALQGWAKGLQIDRINNDGNYEPTNCRWATPAVNCQNRRSSKLSADDALFIYRATESNRSLATRYGVSMVLVQQIKKGRKWKNVTMTN